MRLLMILAVLTSAAAADQPKRPAPVKHEAVQAAEDAINTHLVAGAENTVLMEPAIGVYLESYGLVLSAQVNLFQGTGISPFHPQYTAEEKAKLRSRKLERLDVLKQAMKAVLISAASDARAVPANEKIVLAVSLFYYVFEDRAGLPSQIVMQTTRQDPRSIKVQEF